MDMKNWFRKRPSDGDMREEIESHLAMRAEHDSSDLSDARRRFGNALYTQEQVRHVWIAPFWDTLLQDARFTWRSWRRNPGFAVMAILTLALGLGASTALFSALDRILFRGLPYARADRLVSVGILGGASSTEFVPDHVYDEMWYRISPPPFESVTTIQRTGGPCDVTEQPAERLSCARVQANLLRVLGISVFAGRDFTPQDDVRGAPRVALIRYGLWVRRFGQDRNAIGRTLNLDGQPVSIVGILPPDFEPPEGSADVFLPQQLFPVLEPRALLWAIARLQPNATVQQAEAAAQPLMAAWSANFQRNLRNSARVRARSLRDTQVGDAPRAAWFLLGAVAALLLIACVNVTNLMLARIVARQREFAVRSALGAGKSRLARLALTESLLLSVAAGSLGLLIAFVLLKVFVAMAPASIPKIQQASLDMRVLAVALALSLIVGALVGLWPAISVFRAGALHGTRSTTAALPRVRFALVTVQIAVTVAMLGGASLLLRSLWNLVSVPMGFDSERVLTLSATLNAVRYRTPEQQLAFFDQLLDRAKGIPGTISAALSDAAPPMGVSMLAGIMQVEGRPSDLGDGLSEAIRVSTVTPQYFETLRIPVTAGRTFSETDWQSPAPAAILTESAARVLFPGQAALGHRIRPNDPSQPWRLIVGVVKDIRNAGLTAKPQPELYLVRRHAPTEAARSGFLAMRTTASPAVADAFLKQAAASLDPQTPVVVKTLDQQVASLSERPRFIASLLAAFAYLALLLAAAGLYGVASFLVAQRTRDIGVRMALGATPRLIAGQFLAEAVRWIAAGAALGVVFAWVGRAALKSQLYGVTMRDSASWLGALLVLSAVLMVSVLRPAARAARVDPITALRDE
jgi:putative ABC transport system permease protein